MKVFEKSDENLENTCLFLVSSNIIYFYGRECLMFEIFQKRTLKLLLKIVNYQIGNSVVKKWFKFEHFSQNCKKS